MDSDSSASADQPLSGRHTVITGAGQGIGSAIAERLAAEGARLSLAGRRIEPVQERARTLPDACAFAMDVTDPSSLDRGFSEMLDQNGPVDILINNAGAAESARFTGSDDDQWQRMFAVNLFGPRACIRAVLPSMMEKGQGRIITIASTAGLKGYAYTSAYCAAKHAVLGLTRSLAAELVSTGITVNAVCPGFTDTAMATRSAAKIEQKTGRTAEQARAELTRFNPQGRLIDPKEVAAAVAFLCRDDAAAMTGQALTVAGGEIMT